ncbi:putative bifunctional diguanylate cyclase/phosphodiesterase [Imhoffiella purpurea]|uniref:Diguanylate cyclase n=1 Tax=Imhoffiella purpurea TaxID=1249627 RepID=W9VYN8_9GAMM|nr:EAL domain-containing protein [Imhoffiella purpurea]EXJ15515.1 diguanylate cyclase [Imhoffiella purpurea]
MLGEERPHIIGFFSLRWKAVIVLSLILVVVNASLAFLANAQSIRQFELQQAQIREQQIRHLRAMLHERTQEMSKLASLVPLLGPADAADLTDKLVKALEAHGALLDLEWDIRSVHWIEPHNAHRISWPEGTPELPPELLTRLAESPESTFSLLSCEFGCGQYLVVPQLWKGAFAGSLILERSLADALLSFNALTGAEIAIDVDRIGHRDSAPDDARDHLGFPVITFPERSLPILRAAQASLSDAGPERDPIMIEMDQGWFEIYRIRGLAAGVNAYVINDVTAQQESIRDAWHDSLLIAVFGLLLSESLLLVIMQPPLYRLRDLAAALPLLAERRYADLRAALVPFSHLQLPRDEIDLMVETVGRLTDRMELLQQDREQAEEQLAWLADHDPLTRLMNRRRFNEDFERIVDQAARYGHQGALLFLDLDEFKDVNDLSGHQVGDALLKRVAEQLRGIAQSSDLLARLGGDEFALVLPESSPEDAIASAEAAQKAIRGITLREQGRQHRISASIGIVAFPDHGLDIPQLMANADLAMYQAKDRGRGRWHLFSSQDTSREQLNDRILWKEEIAQALREERFELYFQPIIHLATGAPCHFEALLRMRGKEGGMVFPDRFIPIAEKTGLIQNIDHWVLDQAIETLARNPGMRIAINLSANAMDDPTILSLLKQRIQRHRIAPERLSFEITESVAIDSLSSATRLMRSIQDLGCRFALDDFGSGYASYAYLRQLPVDDIKIDGAFIRDLPNNREDRIFVKAITDMAHGMDKRVIAEFVENTDILTILEEIGVDCAQGYFFSRPARLEDLR